MNGTTNKRAKHRRLLHKRSGQSDHAESQVMAIRTGLTVTVVSHLIALEMDDDTKIAKVIVTVLEGHVVTVLETEALKSAAKMLAERARRFFGRQWAVVNWVPPRQQQQRGYSA